MQTQAEGHHRAWGSSETVAALAVLQVTEGASCDPKHKEPSPKKAMQDQFACVWSPPQPHHTVRAERESPA